MRSKAEGNLYGLYRHGRGPGCTFWLGRREFLKSRGDYGSRPDQSMLTRRSARVQPSLTTSPPAMGRLRESGLAGEIRLDAQRRRICAVYPDCRDLLELPLGQ